MVFCGYVNHLDCLELKPDKVKKSVLSLISREVLQWTAEFLKSKNLCYELGRWIFATCTWFVVKLLRAGETEWTSRRNNVVLVWSSWRSLCLCEVANSATEASHSIMRTSWHPCVKDEQLTAEDRSSLLDLISSKVLRRHEKRHGNSCIQNQNSPLCIDLPASMDYRHSQEICSCNTAVLEIERPDHPCVISQKTQESTTEKH